MKQTLSIPPYPLVNESIGGTLTGLLRAWLKDLFAPRILKATDPIQYEQCTDAELVALIRGGDKQAFAYLYKANVQFLFNFAKKNISRREDCEEIIQDVFMSLWERHEVLHISTVRFYLLNSVRYKVIRYFKKAKVRKKYEEHFRLFEAVYETLPEGERDPETITEILAKGIEELPFRCRTAIKLRLSEEMSNSEIAEYMHISKRTVELYMFQAFKHLRTYCLKAGFFS